MTTRSAGLGGRRLEQQVDPLRAVEPVHGEDEVVVAVAAVRERRGRMRHHLRVEPGRRRAACPATLPDVAKIARASAERGALEREHLPPQRAVLRRLGELAELGAVEVPRLPELVQEPDDLARMANRVRRELRRDHRVDRPPVRLLEVEQPPEERLREHALARIPLERHGDELRLVVARAQLRDEVVGEDLRAAALERHLRNADRELSPARSRARRRGA